MSESCYHAAVIRWPTDWRPRHEADAPNEIEVVERVETGASLTQVTRWVRRFNRTALAADERSLWAVILTSLPHSPLNGAASSKRVDDRQRQERLNCPGPSDGRYGLA